MKKQKKDDLDQLTWADLLWENPGMVLDDVEQPKPKALTEEATSLHHSRRRRERRFDSLHRPSPVRT